MVESKESALIGVEATEPLILTIPGIGHVLGARIVSEIGDVRRFGNASAIVGYAGINPSISRSGKFSSSENRIAKQGSSYLGRALYLAATTKYGPRPRFAITTTRSGWTASPAGRR